MVNGQEMDDIQKKIFEKLSKNEIEEFKSLLVLIKGSVDFVDENGMSPLQHACYKGNKAAVQMLLDQGADPNFSKHGANYSALHFAALTGNKEIVLLLMDAGAMASTLNSVQRTAAQMAAFVGNHGIVATINNYFPKSDLESFTVPQKKETEPLLPPHLLENFHKFVIHVNFHPVRVALNAQKYGLTEHLKPMRRILNLMTENEIAKKHDPNEVMAFKFHYLGWILAEILRCQEHFIQRREQAAEPKHDFIELFVKRALKEDKEGRQDYLEYTIRECSREFKFRDSGIFRQVVAQLANKDCPPALEVVRSAINGQRGFVDDIVSCSTCGEENPDKKCSKCREVQYCDRECQRLHWFLHKKTCARPTSTSNSATEGTPKQKPTVDAAEIQNELANLVTS